MQKLRNTVASTAPNTELKMTVFRNGKNVDVPVKTFGLPQEFLGHGTRDEVLEEAGLTPQHLARQITEAVALRSPGDVSETATAATEGQPVE